MHVMIDLETLSLRVDAAIIQIAAVEFEPMAHGQVYADRALNLSVDLFGQRRDVDPATVDFWREQTSAGSDVLLRSVTGRDTMPLVAAVAELTNWWRAASPIRAVWSHGAAFDLPILQHAYNAMSREPPWHYRDVRDTRTYYLARGEPKTREDLKSDAARWLNAGYRQHDALHDCVMQCLQLQSVM